MVLLEAAPLAPANHCDTTVFRARQRSVYLELFAQERGFTAFHWFDVLRAVLARVEDTPAREKMQDALARIAALLGPASRLARERRTSAPPPRTGEKGN